MKTYWLPKAHLTFISPYSFEAVINKLSRRIADTKEMEKGNSTKPYRGIIKHYQFGMTRNLKQRNDAAPIIEGAVYAFNGQTLIELNIRLKPMTWIFALFFLLFIAIFSAAFVFGNNEESVLVAIGPTVMLLFFYGTLIITFNREVHKSTNDLMYWLNAKPFTSVSQKATEVS